MHLKKIGPKHWENTSTLVQFVGSLYALNNSLIHLKNQESMKFPKQKQSRLKRWKCLLPLFDYYTLHTIHVSHNAPHKDIQILSLNKIKGAQMQSTQRFLEEKSKKGREGRREIGKKGNLRVSYLKPKTTENFQQSCFHCCLAVLI